MSQTKVSLYTEIHRTASSKVLSGNTRQEKRRLVPAVINRKGLLICMGLKVTPRDWLLSSEMHRIYKVNMKIHAVSSLQY